MLELWRFPVAVPAGTAKAAALTFNLTMPPRRVLEIEILVPPGPRGEVGFKIAQAGVQIYPSGAGDFVVTDSETLHWPVEGANTSGAWQVIAYNTGAFPHTLEFRFQVDLPAAQAQATTGTPGLDPLPASAVAAQPAPEAGPATAPDQGPAPPPVSAPPGVPVAPGPQGAPGPQAPPLPGLPPPPPLPPLPQVALDIATAAVLDQIEAAGQAALQGSATAANNAALLDLLEALGQAAHQGAVGAQPTPPPATGSTKVLI